MKKVLFYLFFLCTATFAACTGNDETPSSADLVNVQFAVSRSATNSNGEATDFEQQITSAYVYIFDANGLLENLGHTKVSGLPVIISHDNSSDLLNDHWQVTAGVKDVYVVLNPLPHSLSTEAVDLDTFVPASAADVLALETPGVINLVLSNNKTDAGSVGMLMTGRKSSVSVASGGVGMIDIPVARRMAGIELQLRKDASLDGTPVKINSIRLYNGTSQARFFEPTPLWTGGATAAPGVPVFTLKNNLPQDLDKNTYTAINIQSTYPWMIHPTRFYIAPRPAVVSATDIPYFEILASVGGKATEYDAYFTELTADNKCDLTRPIDIEGNHIYRMQATLTAHSSDVQLDILDWNDQIVDGDIHGAELTVSQSQIIMDWWNLGESFSTTLNVIASENIEFVGYEYNGTTTNDGQNLPAWLPKANITGITSGIAKTETIGLTYVPDNAEYKYPVYLWFKAANIKKRVELIYDNGFLPVNILSTNGWHTNLPAQGIQSSKYGSVSPSGLTGSSGAYAGVNGIMDSVLEEPAIASLSGYTNTLASVLALTPAVGNGASNTAYILSHYPSTPMGKMFKERLIDISWHIPSVGELAVIFNCENYFGGSYRWRPGAYITSSSVRTSSNLNLVYGQTLPTQMNFVVGVGALGGGTTRCITYR